MMWEFGTGGGWMILMMILFWGGTIFLIMWSVDSSADVANRLPAGPWRPSRRGMPEARSLARSSSRCASRLPICNA